MALEIPNVIAALAHVEITDVSGTLHASLQGSSGFSAISRVGAGVFALTLVTPLDVNERQVMLSASPGSLASVTAYTANEDRANSSSTVIRVNVWGTATAAVAADKGFDIVVCQSPSQVTDIDSATWT